MTYPPGHWGRRKRCIPSLRTSGRHGTFFLLAFTHLPTDRVAVRFTLNIKGLPFEARWIELADVQTELPKLGASPSQVLFGKPFYTVPTIYDPNTDRLISDSLKIAQYLDEQYPQTTVLVPPRTLLLQNALIQQISESAGIASLMRLTIQDYAEMVTLDSKDHWLGNVVRVFGAPLDQMALKGEARKEGVATVVAFFTKLGETLGDSQFLGGDEPVFADVVLAAFIIFLGHIEDGETDTWKALREVGGGKWAKFLQRFQEWSA